MDNMQTPKLENVQMQDKYNLRNPSKGTLYFATTHLIFVDHEMRKETWILLMHISSVERLPITTTGSPLLVRTKTFQSVFFVIPRERDCHEMHQTLLRLSQPVHIDELYCFHYKQTPDDLPKSAGWNFFDIQTEFQRMNVPNEQWVLCTANKDYELCDTYPSEIYVPAKASTAILLGSASFRSRGRLPALAYLHHNKAAIARCSQPLSGFSARCMEDEQMLDLIRRANPNCGYMYVVDTRPRINAMVNRAAGKGYENEAFYENIKFQFSGIGNIHVMRKSLQKLVETCEQNSPSMSSFLSGLESSGWLKHIKSILDTSWWIACAVSGGVSVCVHCSDGWDRTAQVCSLAALCLEPHYRTINGYQALIEKDWLSFGHKFTARCGHIACDGRERSPVFTQLLDCTWQLLRQRPEAFQFNERFLLTLHEHAHACQYGTFVGNCQKDRRDLRLSERTFSLWGYMANHLNEYKNPLYNPKAHPDVLKPDLSAQSIRFWRGMYCRHEHGVHPREPLADLLPAAVEHATALDHHINYLAKRITTFKNLLSGRKSSKNKDTTVVNYQNGNIAAVGIESSIESLQIDNKLLYESGATLSELECANHDHPLKDARVPIKPTKIPLITEKGDESIPAGMTQLEEEMNSVALDWSSIKNVTECSCSTPLEHFSRKDEESLDSVRPVANITHHSIMYAPKCLVIVSRQDYIDTFKNCLGIIYTVWVENLGVPLETLVGNLLGCVQVPGAGGPQVRFSIGAGDRQALQPPAAPPLPVTHTSVHMLLRLLGIHNSVTLWCAVMSEHKVLLVSLAAARLAAACRALAALMFPFRYAHVYIPLLPAGLAEVLATPTPFLIGVHSSLKEEVSELLDVIVADLDVGSLHIPVGVNIPQPSGTLLSALQNSLALVLQGELRSADSAFASPPPAPSPPHMLDKELRAIFMRTLARLLQGYRHCLTIIRIHPSPVLTFHKLGFLGRRGLSTCPFAVRLLDSMFFNGLVAERGPPWRATDVWDDLLQNLPEQLRLEGLNPELELQHIQELAMQLHLNENPNPQAYQQRVLRPPEGASARIHQPPLPTLDAAKVRDVIADVTARNAATNKLSIRAPQPRIVPPAAPPTGASELSHALLTNSARRLEVVRGCVSAIFECRYADARKSFPAVLRALRAPAARAALTRHLAARLPTNKHLLHHHQFDLVVRLMNCALQSTTALDEHSIAAAMLPLATAYCRKLCTGVIQYAYMCIQEHQVWTSQQFWEAAFYQDVQRDIKALYLPSPTHHQRVPSPREDEEYLSLLKAQEPSALEIAAEQMRLWPSLPPEKQKELIASEESTLYSQAIHYANRMVYLLLPLEGAGRRADVRGDEADRASNSITNSVAESDSADAESGFEEADPGEAGNNVIKMVSRFVDKVCTEGGVTAEHVRCLHQMIPGVVHMHMESLDAVARESRRLPPVQKPRIVAPALVPGETLAGPALRAFLVPDGRTAPLLPAEGALFLTNYRLVFKGTPTDPFACEQTVVRSFPVCSLTREKAVRTHYLPHLEQSLQEGLQLRSATFQLIKVALDEEVSGEQAEAFRKQLTRLRHPPHPLLHFALAPRAPPPPQHHPPKHHTLKGFAKKTLLKTARKAGLKPKPSKRQKYVLPSADARSLTSPPLMSSLSADTLSLEELELASESGEPAAGRTLERLRERAYARDWARLGLAAMPYRLSHANALYTLCRSYPAVIPVPESVGDDSLRRISRCYRQGRLPVLTWRHPRTHALLARSSAPHHKGVMGMLKATHPNPAATQGGTETTSSIEQERYLATLASCTPTRTELADSSLSLDSLLLGCDDAPASASGPAPVHTPLLTKAAGTLSVLRNSGGKGGGGAPSTGGGTRHFGRWGSLKDRRQPSHLDLYAPRQRLSTADQDSVSVESGWAVRRASLYVVSEKGISGTGTGGAEPVPVEYPDARHTKHAFKKLMRAAIPSAPASAPDEPGFLRLIEESGWLWQLRQLFQLSGAVVDLLDLQASSVLLSLEDGWDATAQISSLAQICLDPYYRTLEGFRILVEKEWLALGHKFQQRSNIAPAPQQGFTPTFLMFLDAVHQLQKQFPLSFEFNDFYLRFVAYHSVSCRFRTFLLDSEAQRAELGLAAADDKRADTNRLGVETGAGPEEEGSAPLGQSMFDYIDRHHQKAPIFYNFLYTPDLDNPVLRPVSSLNCLEVWQYYVSEELSHGAPYDLDTLAPPDLNDTQRRLVTAGYDSVARCMPDAFSGLLERLRQLELELGHLPQKWRVRCDQLDLPNTTELQRNSSMCSGVVRRATLTAHKRSTREILVRGRLAAAPPAPAHRWAPAASAAPARCDHCQDLLWGPLKSGVRCMDCGAACHERCVETFALSCTKYKAPPAQDREPMRPATGNSVSTLQSSSQQYYEQFSSNVAENRTHEGHLYKRGALLKGWKQRWFVLDSIKHQLRYYDAMEDSHCKGFIDLAEVITVTQAPAAPGPPKKCDDRSFFDLRTSRRTYNFCASDAAAAQEWIEKLQACLQ